MTSYRNQNTGQYDLGSAPPYISWTVVKGDTAAFQIYVEDDGSQPIDLSAWTIAMELKRPQSGAPGEITDDATLLFRIYPAPGPNDGVGEFTVSLTAEQSASLQTNDIFDVELSNLEDQIVWTVAQGKMIILEDVTA